MSVVPCRRDTNRPIAREATRDGVGPARRFATLPALASLLLAASPLLSACTSTVNRALPKG